MTPKDVLTQLTSPDPVGVSLALLRMRAYRFSDDQRLYVLAEWLEERFIRGHQPRPDTLAYVEDSLNRLRSHGNLLPYEESIADAEELDVRAELSHRHEHNHTVIEGYEPRQLVFIVGAPRSGTSHLYNLLAYTGHLAYFTTVTCWAWPTHNLTRPERFPFEHLDRSVFDIDNKATRIVPALAAPHEAEDVNARAIPTYQHLGGHTYRLEPARQRNPDLLRRTAQAHLAHFRRDVLLTKSPFNSLRIAALEDLWGTKARYVHIVRDKHDVAESMRRNRFSFTTPDRPLTEEEAWTYFVSNIEENAPRDRLLTITFDQLQANSEAAIANVLAWLLEPRRQALPHTDGGEPSRPLESGHRSLPASNPRNGT